MNSGALLEFSDDIPVIIVPDLHARNFFLISLLNLPITGIPVLELLKENKIRIICLGDGMHAEAREKQRWINAYSEYIDGNIQNDFIYQEMAESLQLMLFVMRLKIFNPSFFHFLKGNHENILNEEGNGNHSFSKFAFEGQMVKEFMFSYYGREITEKYAFFEKLLPLFVIGKGFLASHAEPASSYTKNQLIHGASDDIICDGLTWTANDVVSGDAVKKMLTKYQKNFPKALYFAGHRPIKNKIQYRADGKFIQIHNPFLTNVVYLEPGGDFNPDKNILEVGEYHG